MSHWNYISAILSFILGGYLLFAAYQRRNKKHKHLRALASVIAAWCLYLLYHQITSAKSDLNLPAEEIIFLTDGASNDTLNRLVKDYPSASIYTNDPALASTNRNAVLVTQLNEIPGLTGRVSVVKKNSTQLVNIEPTLETAPALSSQTIKTIHLLGSGLEEAELDLINKSELVFYPTVLTTHFKSVNWSRQVQAGEKLIIQGSCKNEGNKELNLILEGFNTRLDSVKIHSDTITKFELRTVPKQAGRAVYSLLLMDDKDTLQQEKIPFETINSNPLQILMLASSPDFENKFLKNWLFSNNYGLAIRTLISKNKYNTEYLNISGVKTERINSNLLSKFDLVIGDATALNQLAPTELNSIRSAVQEEGLGLIIKLDSTTSQSRFFNGPFRYNQSNSVNSQVLQLNTRDTAVGMPILTAIRPRFIANSEQLKPLISDKEGHVFSAVAALGSGKLLSTTIGNTYNWVLSGDTVAYRGFWSDLITEAAKTRMLPQLYSIDPAIPIIDMPVTIMLEADDSLPPVMRVNQSLVALHQRFNLPFQWTGNFWPRKTGWQVNVANDSHPFSWYCFGTNDWKTLRAYRKILSNTLRANGFTRDQTVAANLAGNSFQRNAKIYLFIMFIICCTYLWIEEKFHNSR